MWQETKKCVVRFGPAFMLALVACAVTHGQDVRSDYLPGTDFSKYHSYSWVTAPGAPILGPLPAPNQILDAQIMQSVDSQLAGKGFAKVDSGKADLIVQYQVGVDQERQWNGFGTADRLGLGGNFGTAMGTATSSTINNGILVVNIYDAETKRLIWTGFAVREVTLSKNQEKNRKNLDKATAKLLKDFPPGRK